MTQINPFAGSVVQSTTMQRTQSAERDRQVQRARSLTRTAAAEGDHLERQVEGAQELRPIHDQPQDPPRQHRRSGKPRTGEQAPAAPRRLDLTA